MKKILVSMVHNVLFRFIKARSEAIRFMVAQDIVSIFYAADHAEIGLFQVS